MMGVVAMVVVMPLMVMVMRAVVVIAVVLFVCLPGVRLACTTARAMRLAQGATRAF